MTERDQPCRHPLDDVDSTVRDGDLHAHCGRCDTSWAGSDTPFALVIRLAQATTDDFRGVFSASDATDNLAQQVRRDLGLTTQREGG